MIIDESYNDYLLAAELFEKFKLNRERLKERHVKAVTKILKVMTKVVLYA